MGDVTKAITKNLDIILENKQIIDDHEALIAQSNATKLVIDDSKPIRVTDLDEIAEVIKTVNKHESSIKTLTEKTLQAKKDLYNLLKDYSGKDITLHYRSNHITLNVSRSFLDEPYKEKEKIKVVYQGGEI